MFKRPVYRQFNQSIKGKLLAIALSLIAGIAVYLSFTLLFSPASVVIAKNDIPEASLIELNDLEVIKVAKKDLHKDAYTSPEDLVGKISLTPIFKGQQVLNKQINLGAGIEDVNPGGFKPHQTMLTLTTQQAIWPAYLNVGDLVTVVSIHSTEGMVIEEAVGKISRPSSTSTLRHLKNLQEAQASSPNDATISFVTDVEGGKQVLLALKTSDMVYLMPRHKDLGGVD